METRTVSDIKALELQATLNVVKAGKAKIDPAFYSIQVHGNYMLVDPVNEMPFVFMAPNTVHVFSSAPGSGTDHLRKRIEAEIFFKALVDASGPKSR